MRHPAATCAPPPRPPPPYPTAPRPRPHAGTEVPPPRPPRAPIGRLHPATPCHALAAPPPRDSGFRERCSGWAPLSSPGSLWEQRPQLSRGFSIAGPSRVTSTRGPPPSCSVCGRKGAYANNLEFQVPDWDRLQDYHHPAGRPAGQAGTLGILLVYDITNRWSFDGIDRWIKEIDEHAPGVPRILVGNRLHLAFKRQVPTEQARAYAEKNCMTFFEVSPLCNFNVIESFTELSRIVLMRHGMEKIWRPNRAGGQVPGSASQAVGLSSPTRTELPRRPGKLSSRPG
ncbi:ras-related protein Rab-40C isoform X3 [Tursiops truncatus]|uniref:ras-related protein Rab-40C isoform X3 n=1 Tax=Tursiops truncatus TaxID=9739 RepID=UPI003CCF3C27